MLHWQEFLLRFASQAMTLMCWRLSKLSEEGRMTHEMASNVKAWTTQVRSSAQGIWPKPAGEHCTFKNCGQRRQQLTSRSTNTSCDAAITVLSSVSFQDQFAGLEGTVKLMVCWWGARRGGRWLRWLGRCWAVMALCPTSSWPSSSAIWRWGGAGCPTSSGCG